MAKITASAPVLLVRDVVRAAEYFRDRVGFAYDRFWGEPPAFCILWRDGHALMLSQVDPEVPVTPNWKIRENMWDVYFWVDDVEGLYTELRDRGATIDYELCVKPYQVNEFGIQDLDEHDVGFGEIRRGD